MGRRRSEGTERCLEQDMANFAWAMARALDDGPSRLAIDFLGHDRRDRGAGNP